jgi:hypothetical protein
MRTSITRYPKSIDFLVENLIGKLLDKSDSISRLKFSSFYRIESQDKEIFGYIFNIKQAYGSGISNCGYNSLYNIIPISFSQIFFMIYEDKLHLCHMFIIDRLKKTILYQRAWALSKEGPFQE